MIESSLSRRRIAFGFSSFSLLLRFSLILLESTYYVRLNLTCISFERVLAKQSESKLVLYFQILKIYLIPDQGMPPRTWSAPVNSS